MHVSEMTVTGTGEDSEFGKQSSQSSWTFELGSGRVRPPSSLKGGFSG